MSEPKFKRKGKAERRDEILSAALRLANKDNYLAITRDAIAEEAGVSIGLVTFHFGTMIKLRRDVMRAAIKGSLVKIVAEGLAYGDPHARKAPDELKKKAAEILCAAS